MSISTERLSLAYERAKADLLAERAQQGHWVGELATSALSTSTAVSALSLVDRDQHRDLIARGIRWLADHQNADGGWGDTLQSYSNVATSMLAVAAFHLAAATDDHADPVERANGYIDSKGRVDGLRQRYGKDKTFAVPILTNCALAGLADWRDVSPLPFEAACLPQSFYRFIRLPVVSYAIPALVAIGQARYFHRKPRNPVMRLIRGSAVRLSMKVLQRIQPTSGGFLEATPLTSFVVMSLAATGREAHPVTRNGVKFIVDSVRPDGSWPIDTNLATWNTTLSINALDAGGEDVGRLECLDWLLDCQYRTVHAYTGADPGGWGWSDLSGSVPDADDTPGALLALAAWYESDSVSGTDRERIAEAAAAGSAWLLGLQNRDGGWPTFCRGWGQLPFDRSGADLTAHAMRALSRWAAIASKVGRNWPTVVAAVARGSRYLSQQQRSDGSWIPLWFGNQDHPYEENPVYGTAKVLAAYRDLNRMDAAEARRAVKWLVDVQNRDGSWGCGVKNARTADGSPSASVEETALALEGLLAAWPETKVHDAVDRGLNWLMDRVESDRHRENAPIGFYFAKLWYYERLYPLTFAVSALGHAVNTVSHPAEADARPAAAHLTDA